MAPIIGGVKGERDFPGTVKIYDAGTQPNVFTVIEAAGKITDVLAKELEGKSPQEA